jgi:hypothetical protein
MTAAPADPGPNPAPPAIVDTRGMRSIADVRWTPAERAGLVMLAALVAHACGLDPVVAAPLFVGAVLYAAIKGNGAPRPQAALPKHQQRALPAPLLLARHADGELGLPLVPYRSAPPAAESAAPPAPRAS